MATKSKDVYGIFSYPFREHGYTFTQVKITRGRLLDAEAEIGRIRRNEPMYDSDEIAVQEADRLAAACRAEGVNELYSTGYGQELTVTFQHYRTNEDGTIDYCDPRFDLGSSPHDIERALPLFRKLARVIRTPDDIATVLKSTVELCGYEAGKHLVKPRQRAEKAA